MRAHGAGAPPGPLSGARVLEISDEKVQLCGKILAGLGAEVIKIEPPGGCATRRIGPFHRDTPHVERSLYFWHYNVGKASVTLDLATPDGQALLSELAARADVLLEGEPPGVMGRRGLGYDRLGKVNPCLVYCSITPYGQTGPWSSYRASDLTLLASGGQMGVSGYDPADDPARTPIAPGGGNALHIGGNYAAVAVMLALHARDYTGAGDYIDLSVHEAVALCTEGAFAEYLMTGENRRRQTGRHAAGVKTPPVQFLCRDGKYMNSVLPGVDPEAFLRLVSWLDEEGLAADLKDERLLDSEALRSEMPRVLAAVRRLCGKLTSEEAFHGAQRRKFPWSIIRTPSDVAGDPHQADRGFFVEVEHPELGCCFTYPGAPVVFSETPWRLERRAPLVGEDTIAVLHGELGVSLGRINALRETGVI